MGVFLDRKNEVVTRIGTAKGKGWNHGCRVSKYCCLGAVQSHMFQDWQLFSTYFDKHAQNSGRAFNQHQESLPGCFCPAGGGLGVYVITGH